MNSLITAPVLLIAFNRPDTTEIVFKKIREVQPPKLYIAVDGPRENKEGEADLVDKVKQIVHKVDWNCNVKYLIRDKNLGCKHGVSGAISWVFENEDRVIIIEDDIVAASTFFYFAEELLEKYKNEDIVAMISANNYTPIKKDESDDYLFSGNAHHIWGWATWKRVWSQFNTDIPELEEALKSNLQEMQFTSPKEKAFFLKYFTGLLLKIHTKTENTWDSQFAFFIKQNRLLSIVPRLNLASNIGIESSRTDIAASENSHYYPAFENFTFLKHPNSIQLDIQYDKNHFKKHINRKISLTNRVVHKVKNILKFK